MHEQQSQRGPAERPVAERARAAAATHWARLCRGGNDNQLGEFDNNYLGCWPDRSAFATEFAADLGLPQQLADLDSPLQPYLRLDVAAIVQRLEDDDDLAFAEDEHGLHVFVHPGRPPRTTPPAASLFRPRLQLVEDDGRSRSWQPPRIGLWSQRA